MISLIDGDICAYRTAAASEEADLEICLLRLDRMVREIIHVTEADEYRIFLSGEENFRYKLYPEYKANRKDIVRPKWLQNCREFLVTNWNAELADNCEADDMLGLNQDYYDNTTIICSIDKDLLQIPGRHYNFVKDEWYEISLKGGLYSFYTQLLTGDRSDNIPGVKGLGPKKAALLLEGCESELEMFNVCREQYKDDYLLEIYGKCLWIQQKGKQWEFDLLIGKIQLDSEEEIQFNSTSSIQTSKQIGQSTEPISTTTSGMQDSGDWMGCSEQMEQQVFLT